MSVTCFYNQMLAGNGSCIDCPAGYVGTNCSSVCPFDYYGSYCRHKCYCSSYEYCHHITGCIFLPNATNQVGEITAEHLQTATEVGEIATKHLQTGLNVPSVQTTLLTFELLVIILVIVGCNLLLTAILLQCFIRKRMQNKDRHQTGNVADSSSNKSEKNEGNEDMQRETIELPSFDYEPPIIPTERPENNVYMDIRTV